MNALGKLSWDWKKIEWVAAGAHAQLCGARIESVSVPERYLIPEGYQKSEWMLHCKKGRNIRSLIFSLLPFSTYFYVLDEKLKKAPTAPLSPFHQALRKHLDGETLRSIRSLVRERIIQIQFSNDLCLILYFFSSRPYGRLTRKGESLAVSEHAPEVFPEGPPENLTALPPDELPKISEFFRSFNESLKTGQEGQATEKVRKKYLEQKKQIEKKLASLDLSEARLPITIARQKAEALAVQAELYALPDSQSTFHPAPTVTIKKPPEQTWADWMQNTFDRIKKEQRRASEIAKQRGEFANELARVLAESNALESGAPKNPRDENSPSEEIPFQDFKGRLHQSTQGFYILIGKNLAQNRELSLKIARGNDWWMHVQGRPSPHLVIICRDGKRPPPLETLLEAAQLLVFYSGGKDWGKTRVDYTQKKFVRASKGRSDLEYTQNKTLEVEIDDAQMKILLAATAVKGR